MTETDLGSGGPGGGEGARGGEGGGLAREEGLGGDEHGAVVVEVCGLFLLLGSAKWRRALMEPVGKRFERWGRETCVN